MELLAINQNAVVDKCDLLLVVQEVVREVITYVAKYTTTEHSCCCVPVVEEDCMSELIEWCCESDEEGRRHDKAITVHREVVVDAVEKEVCRYADSVVRKVS